MLPWLEICLHELVGRDAETSMSDSDHQVGQSIPEIQGMRAISIIGGILFHAELGFPGGFVGVDVFFVISGF